MRGRGRGGCAGVAPVGAATDTVVPGAPTIISATAVAQGATVTWLAAEERRRRAGARLSHPVHLEQRRVRDGAQRLPDSPVTVHGMSVGKKYTCTVRGAEHQRSRQRVESVGGGRPAPAAEPGTAGRADERPGEARRRGASSSRTRRPRRRSATCRSTNTAPGCRSTDGGVTTAEKRRWMAPGIDVRHLTPGKTYHCDVAARNMLGYGPFSEPSDDVVTHCLAAPTERPDRHLVEGDPAGRRGRVQEARQRRRWTHIRLSRHVHLEQRWGHENAGRRQVADPRCTGCRSRSGTPVSSPRGTREASARRPTLRIPSCRSLTEHRVTRAGRSRSCCRRGP